MADSFPVPLVPEPPPYPLGQLTTSELSTYKRQLEHALSSKGLPAEAPIRGELHAKLSKIQMEEARRIEITSADASWPMHN